MPSTSTSSIMSTIARSGWCCSASALAPSVRLARPTTRYPASSSRSRRRSAARKSSCTMRILADVATLCPPYPVALSSTLGRASAQRNAHVAAKTAALEIELGAATELVGNTALDDDAAEAALLGRRDPRAAGLDPSQDQHLPFDGGGD